jgi:hypothetical protein
MSLNVLHVMQQHTLGGASRSILAHAAHATREFGSRHTIVSLTEPQPRAVDDARARGIDVLAAPGTADLDRAVDAADIVQVHYWNAPDVVSFIRTASRPMRTLVWCDVAGDSAPHVVTSALVRWPDAFVACCEYTGSLPVFTAAVAEGRTC